MGHVGNDIVGGGDAGPDARNDVVGKDLGESGDGMIVMGKSEAVAASERPSFVYLYAQQDESRLLYESVTHTCR